MAVKIKVKKPKKESDRPTFLDKDKKSKKDKFKTDVKKLLKPDFKAGYDVNPIEALLAAILEELQGS